MNIDFFTISVQIVNFLILIFILNKLLLKPIIKSLEERRESIKLKMLDIDNKTQELDKEKTFYENKIKEFEKEKIEKERQIDLELKEIKEKKLEELKTLYLQKEEILKNNLNSLQDDLIENTSKVICENISTFLNSLLLNIADEPLNNRLFNNFLKDIENFSIEEKINIQNSLNQNSKITVFYSFELSEEQKKELEAVLKKIKLDFEKIEYIYNEDLVLGIKLQIGSIIINSNIQSVIENFNNRLKNALSK